MPLPRRLAEINRAGLNRLTSRLFVFLPPFALIEHLGRITGQTYVTPVMVFRSGDTWRIALTYGPTTDWVRNVLDADEAVLVYRRRRCSVGHPRIDSSAYATQSFPYVVRFALRVLNTQQVLELKTGTTGSNTHHG